MSDVAKVTVTVAADPATAFAIFTEETDLWWRRGFKFRMAGRQPGTLLFEGGVGGRLMEQFATPDGPRVVVMGQITVWDPPNRFAFVWRAANFAPEESTEVEVLFEAAGEQTRVTVCHRGWAQLRADHPVRHGADAAGTIRNIGLWWGELMTSLREHASG